jgi:hypothetical protein
VQNIPVLFKHVDLFHTRNRLDAELFERSLELAVVALLGSHRLFDLLAAGSALAACGVLVIGCVRVVHALLRLCAWPGSV